MNSLPNGTRSTRPEASVRPLRAITRSLDWSISSLRTFSTSVGICASKAALCATGRARTAADTNAVHDRLLQSMRVRFSDSEQWSSPVKPPRSQNYVKPHDARTRVHVATPRGRGSDRSLLHLPLLLTAGTPTARSNRCPRALRCPPPRAVSGLRQAQEWSVVRGVVEAPL